MEKNQTICCQSNKSELILSTLKKTWLVDIDGTILVHNGYKRKIENEILPGVEDFFKRIPKSDIIILMTARKKRYYFQTVRTLKKHKLRWNKIIWNVSMGERILLNDKKPSGLKMAHAVNLDRDKGINIEVIFDESV